MVHAEVEHIRSREATTFGYGLCQDGEVAENSVLGSPNREFRNVAWVFDDRAFRLEGDSIGHIGVGKVERELHLQCLPREADGRLAIQSEWPAFLAGIAERDGFRFAGFDEDWPNGDGLLGGQPFVDLQRQPVVRPGLELRGPRFGIEGAAVEALWTVVGGLTIHDPNRGDGVEALGKGALTTAANRQPISFEQVDRLDRDEDRIVAPLC